jgi:hypothetical protein
MPASTSALTTGTYELRARMSRGSSTTIRSPRGRVTNSRADSKKPPRGTRRPTLRSDTVGFVARPSPISAAAAPMANAPISAPFTAGCGSIQRVYGLLLLD